MSSRIVKSGSGWRLGWDAEAGEFKGLIGGDNWAIELTEAELDDFCRLLGQLTQSMEKMAEELMDEERIACEAESDRLWMQVEGYPESYTVQFILNAGRRGEGKWPFEAALGLLQEARTLKTF
jgi:hypothetical protein